MNHNTLNGQFYGGDHIEELTFYYEIIIDRTSVEIFADHGKFSIIAPLEKAKNNQGLEFKNNWGQIEIEELTLYELNSIWK